MLHSGEEMERRGQRVEMGALLFSRPSSRSFIDLVAVCVYGTRARFSLPASPLFGGPGVGAASFDGPWCRWRTEIPRCPCFSVGEKKKVEEHKFVTVLDEARDIWMFNVLGVLGARLMRIRYELILMRNQRSSEDVT